MASDALIRIDHLHKTYHMGDNHVHALRGISLEIARGSLVAIMYNSGAANSNYVVSIGGKNLQFAMPASGWATVRYVP